MPPQLQKVTSFSLDIDDWYSCHTSDDEAYQDALERNSVASFFTAYGATSGAPSVAYVSIALGSPPRIADADQALAEMVPEPLSYVRGHREPPEFDAHEVPAFKRNRYSPGRSPALAPPTISTTPVARARLFPRWSHRRAMPARASSPCTFRSAAPLAVQPPPPSPEPPTEQRQSQPTSTVRVSITVQPDGTSVQLHVVPAVIFLGSLTVPATAATSTDYSAMLLGPDGGLGPEDSGLGYGEPHPIQGDDLRASGQLSTASPDSCDDASLPPHSHLCQRDNDSCRDPRTPKDQTKARRRAGDKDHKAAERKAAGGFPGSGIIQRLFSGLRSSFGGGNFYPAPPPATIQELGSELLLASTAAAPPGLALAAAAAQGVPVIAGFVHAAAASVNASFEAAAPGEDRVDEAAAAAQQLSADIFRNVLRASSGGANASASKSLVSPRDTAFQQPTEGHSPKRDQLPSSPALAPLVETAASADGNSGNSQPATPAGRLAASSSSSRHQSPGDDKQSAAGLAALALLTGLAIDVTADIAGEPCTDGQDQEHQTPLAPAAEVEGKEEEENAAVVDLDGGLKLLGRLDIQTLQTGDGVDGNDLPTPQLEQCDSPVTAKGTAAPESSSPLGIAAGLDAPPHTAAASAVPADLSPPDTESPRTISKKAYGTVARLVKKLAPNFKDSTVASIMSTGASGSSTALPVAVSDPPPALTPSASLTPAGTPLTAALPEVPSDAGSQAAVGSQPPSIFVFGQEQPKQAKQPSIKTRPSAPKAAPASEDQEAQAEAPGRKRKAELEILPNAKVPVVESPHSRPPLEAEPPGAIPESPADTQPDTSPDSADSNSHETCSASLIVNKTEVEQPLEAPSSKPVEGHPHAAVEAGEAAVEAEEVTADEAAATPSAPTAQLDEAPLITVAPAGSDGVEASNPKLQAGEAQTRAQEEVAAAAATLDLQKVNSVSTATDVPLPEAAMAPAVVAMAAVGPTEEPEAVAAATATDDLVPEAPATTVAIATDSSHGAAIVVHLAVANLLEAAAPAPLAADMANIVEQASKEFGVVVVSDQQVGPASSDVQPAVGAAAEPLAAEEVPAEAAALDREPEEAIAAAVAASGEHSDQPVAASSPRSDFEVPDAVGGCGDLQSQTASQQAAAHLDLQPGVAPCAADMAAVPEQAGIVTAKRESEPSVPPAAAVSAGPGVEQLPAADEQSTVAPLEAPNVELGPLPRDSEVPQAAVEPRPASSAGAGQPDLPVEASLAPSMSFNAEQTKVAAAVTSSDRVQPHPTSMATEEVVKPQPTAGLAVKLEGPKSATATVEITRDQAPAGAEGAALESTCAKPKPVSCDAETPTVVEAVHETPTAATGGAQPVDGAPLKSARSAATTDATSVLSMAGEEFEGVAVKKAKSGKTAKKAKKFASSLISCFRP